MSQDTTVTNGTAFAAACESTKAFSRTWDEAHRRIDSIVTALNEGRTAEDILANSTVTLTSRKGEVMGTEVPEHGELAVRAAEVVIALGVTSHQAWTWFKTRKHESEKGDARYKAQVIADILVRCADDLDAMRAEFKGLYEESLTGASGETTRRKAEKAKWAATIKAATKGVETSLKEGGTLSTLERADLIRLQALITAALA